MLERWYELTNKTWGAVLHETARRHPGLEFVVYGGQRVPYQAFHLEVQRFARGLLDLGVRPGDAVALWMTNCVEWLVAQFAAYTIGAPLVPLNTRLSRSEVADALRRSDATTLILRSRFLAGALDAVARLERIIPEIGCSEPERLAARGLPRLERVICLGEDRPRGAYAFDEVLERGRGWASDDALRSAQIGVNPFDVCNIVYTSGTTGAPKGGMSMHRNNMAAMYHWIERSGLRPADRIYLGVPLATNFGCAYVSQVSVMAGATIVAQETFDPTRALRAIQDERVTWFPGAPTMYAMMLAAPTRARFDLGSLRTAIVGGAPCPAETIRAMKDDLGFRHIVQCYGLSECAGLSTSTLLDDPLERTATSVGLPFPSCALRIVDPETQEDVPAGAQGEVWLHDVLPGSCVGRGYYAMPDKTAEAITPDGWFRTGDLGCLDEAGRLSITGRLKDMYLVGGFNAYPAEIEVVLHTHPAVELAQVVGVPDPRLGEVGCAFIELREGEREDAQEIVLFCRKRMANYKVPRYVIFVRKDELPLTSSGKVKKFVLRERAIRDLGLSE